jgi:hypothetical protein
MIQLKRYNQASNSPNTKSDGHSHELVSGAFEDHTPVPCDSSKSLNKSGIKMRMKGRWQSGNEKNPEAEKKDTTEKPRTGRP